MEGVKGEQRGWMNRKRVAPTENKGTHDIRERAEKRQKDDRGSEERGKKTGEGVGCFWVC